MQATGLNRDGRATGTDECITHLVALVVSDGGVAEIEVPRARIGDNRQKKHTTRPQR